MKFQDIKQLTESGNYNVDVPLTHLPRVTKEFVEEYGLQLNPDFQRGHVWTREQQIAYVEFLLRGGRSSRTIYLNHPGWMKVHLKGEFVCVDGLQRWTAILAFLNNEIPAFGTLYKDFEDRLSLGITLQLNVNDLQTKAEVLQWYLEMNSGGTVHSDAEIERVRDMLSRELG